MSERRLDAEPAGGTENAAPVTVEVARSTVAGWLASGRLSSGLHQIAIALDSEVGYLRGARNFWINETRSAHHAAERAEDELARLRASLSDVIACAHGGGTTCTRDNYGWSVCCSLRRRMRKAGLLPSPTREVEVGGGA